MNTKKEKSSSRGALPAEAPLSPWLAFVVQFRTDSGGATKSYTGRVEHMTSGRMAHFRSQAELWTFFTQVLAEEEQRSKEQENCPPAPPDRLSDEEP
jgi:hypothetical protein